MSQNKDFTGYFDKNCTPLFSGDDISFMGERGRISKIKGEFVIKIVFEIVKLNYESAILIEKK